MTDIHDIKPILTFGPDRHWLVWILAAVAAAVVLAAIAWWYRRWRLSRSGSAQPAFAPAPPDIEACHLLDALEALCPMAARPFYFQLSAILRQYMERRFSLPAAEMTSEELLPRIGSLSLDPDLAVRLADFCRTADPIKYAPAVQNLTDMSLDLRFVRDFVRRTTEAGPQPEEEVTQEPCSASPIHTS